jgi:ferredoxin
MFYQFGFESSYDSISRIEANFFGRIVRALHKYASGAAVIFALLHGWRTLFQDRFRGPRWLAWTTGVSMAAFVWLIGITGYWLVWDERAAVLNQTLINLINNSQLGTNFLVNYLVTPNAGSGWVFLVLVISVHLGLSALVGLFFWWHIKRLRRPKWLPPQYWMVTIAVILVMASVFFPVGMLSTIDPNRLPEKISIDLFYLFYLPGGLYWPISFWILVLLIVCIILLIPWLLSRKTNPPIAVDSDRCTGCTLCAADCPYKAIQMLDRTDNKKHKLIAKIDSKLCVGCGVCIGTCTPMAMTLGDSPAEPLWEETLSNISKRGSSTIKVVFTCERHATQGAMPYFCNETINRDVEGLLVQIVPLTCVAMVHPDLIVKALEAGANEIQFIGCPPEDCANREGNLWIQDRIERQRLPRLKSSYSDAHITADWLPPNDFKRGLEIPNTNRDATGYRLDFGEIKWQYFLPAIFMVAVVMIGQIWLSNINYQPFPVETAMLELSLKHKAGYPLIQTDDNIEPVLGINHPTRLILEVDGQTILDKSYDPQGSSQESIAFEQFPLQTGKHQIKMTMFDRPNQNEGAIVFEKSKFLTENQIFRLDYTDKQLSGNPSLGKSLFYDRSIGKGGSCSLCHSLNPDEVLVGPSLAGVATRAGNRVTGMNSEAYLYQSILEPDTYIVDGFPAGQMLPDLGERLSSDQIDNLVAFLLTLK